MIKLLLLRLKMPLIALVFFLTTQYANAQIALVRCTQGTDSVHYSTMGAISTAISNGTHRGFIKVLFKTSVSSTSNFFLDTTANYDSILFAPHYTVTTPITLEYLATGAISFRLGNVRFDGKNLITLKGGQSNYFVFRSISTLKPAKNFVFENLNIESTNYPTSLSTGSAFNISTAAATRSNIENIVIRNCVIKYFTTAFSVIGTTDTTRAVKNIYFRNNEIINYTSPGISIGNVLGNIEVSGNILRHDGIVKPSGSTIRSISVSALIGNSTVLIEKNKIFNYDFTTTASALVSGIFIQKATNVPTSIQIRNNYINISPILSNFTAKCYGIYYFNNTGTNTRSSIYNNTIVLGGSTVSTGGTSTLLSAGVYSTALLNNSSMNICNNLIVNKRTGYSSEHFSFVLPSDVYRTNSGTAGSDMYFYNNVVYCPDTAYNFRSFETLFTTNSGGGAKLYPYALNNLQSTYGIAKFNVLRGIDVSFTGTNSPDFAAKFNGFSGMRGTNFLKANDDIYGNPRNGTYPYVGCYEPQGFPLAKSNDLKITSYETMGKISKDNNLPWRVSVRVDNNGWDTVTSATVNLNVTGDVSLSKQLTFNNIIPGLFDINLFPDITAADFGNSAPKSVTATIALPNDDTASGNTESFAFELTESEASWALKPNLSSQPTLTSALGRNVANESWVARFTQSRSDSINAVTGYFQTGGQQAQVVLYADDNDDGSPGTLFYIGAPFTTVAGLNTISIPPQSVSYRFFAGFMQVGTTPLGIQGRARKSIGFNLRDFYFIDSFGETSRLDEGFGTESSIAIGVKYKPAVQFTDLKVSAITGPAKYGCLGSAEMVKVRLRNTSANAARYFESAATINVSITGPNSAVQNISRTLNTDSLIGNDSVVYNISNADFSLEGEYTLTASLTWAADMNAANNSISGHIIKQTRISTLPSTIKFTETGVDADSKAIEFESVAGGVNFSYAASQANPSLATNRGTGVATVQFSSGNGNADERARIWLPCISATTNSPKLLFYMSTSNAGTTSDQVVVKYTTDGGQNFTTVTSFNRRTLNPAAWELKSVSLPNITGMRVVLEAVRGEGITSSSISISYLYFVDCLSDNTWLGVDNSSWNDPINWCGGVVPATNTPIAPSISAAPFPPIVSTPIALTDLNIDGKYITGNGGKVTISGNLNILENADIVDTASGFQGFEMDNGDINVSTVSTIRNLIIANSTARLYSTIGNKLFVDGTISFTGGGNLLNFGDITLKSSLGRTGNLGAITGGSSFTGTITIERAINPISFNQTGSHHYITSPLINQTFGSAFASIGNKNPRSYTLGSATVYGYDPTLAPSAYNGWAPPAGDNAPMVAGLGYSMIFKSSFHQSSAPTYYTSKYAVTGTPRMGNFSINLKYCAANCTYTGTDPNGYNLLGNPYPSNISWDLVSKTNVDDAIWIWNGSNGVYGSFVGGVGINEQTDVIPSSAGFFVRANSTGASVSYTESVKTSDQVNFLRRAPVTMFRVRLNGHYTAASDETAIVFRANATAGYDRQFDADKMGSALVHISTMPIGSNKEYGINSMPAITAQNQDLILVAKSTRTGLHRFTFSGFENWDFNTSLFLKDNYTRTITPITPNMEYRFVVNADSASAQIGRFVISYSNASLSVSEGIQSPKFEVYPNPMKSGNALNFYINGVNSTDASITITDVSGKVVYQTELNNLSSEESKMGQLSGLNLKSGMYVVQLNSASGIITKRVIVE